MVPSTDLVRCSIDMPFFDFTAFFSVDIPGLGVVVLGVCFLGVCFCFWGIDASSSTSSPSPPSPPSLLLCDPSTLISKAGKMLFLAVGFAFFSYCLANFALKCVGSLHANLKRFCKLSTKQTNYE
mgnify:CR=1 FL=1